MLNESASLYFLMNEWKRERKKDRKLKRKRERKGEIKRKWTKLKVERYAYIYIETADLNGVSNNSMKWIEIKVEDWLSSV